MPDADAPLPGVTVPRLPSGSQGSWGQGSVPWTSEDADSLRCPRPGPLPVQEKRRAERAEQQRIRSEREKERQARMAVSVLWKWGSGWAWGAWGHGLCVHPCTADRLLNPGRKKELARRRRRRGRGRRRRRARRRRSPTCCTLGVTCRRWDPSQGGWHGATAAPGKGSAMG